MAKTKLYDNWTFQRKLPEPFNDPYVKERRTDVYSKHNKVSSKQSTLHSPSLKAIMYYADLEYFSMTGGVGTTFGAIGIQGDNLNIVESQNGKGEIDAVVFNKISGKFSAGSFENLTSSPVQYLIKEDGRSGMSLFLALMPIALTDEEFSREYNCFLDYRTKNFPDLEQAAICASILCDNLYRRIENADNLGIAGIKTNVPKTGSIQPLTPLNINKGVYSPTTTFFGEFNILKFGMNPVKLVSTVNHSDFVGKYVLTNSELSSAEKKLIPKLESWYVVPTEVVRICQHAKATTSSVAPMRNFMLRGPAGTGKTEGAKAISAGLGIPYVHITCSANTEIMDLLGQILPDIKGLNKKDTISPSAYPTFDDIRMDPSSAYFKLTGEYSDEVTEDDVYDKLVEVIKATADMGKELEESKQEQGFKYIDTPLVDAIRYGYLCEIQEPSIVGNPGVLVGLNSLLDRCNAITLPTGEKINRHPNTVIVVTTNNDYNGCKDINQSVISRMNLVIDVDQPDIDTLIKRVSGITGCKDISSIKKMAEAIKDITERCRETMITDGSCGVRELISWVQSFMICGDLMEAAKYTILASVSSDPENRAEILSTCLEPKFE